MQALAEDFFVEVAVVFDVPDDLGAQKICVTEADEGFKILGKLACAFLGEKVYDCADKYAQIFFKNDFQLLLSKRLVGTLAERDVFIDIIQNKIHYLWQTCVSLMKRLYDILDLLFIGKGKQIVVIFKMIVKSVAVNITLGHYVLHSYF